jgi:uncharacterized protein YggT (Ycf19 family)
MDENDKVRVDEARKLRQHEQVKGEIRDEIHREIRTRAERVAPSDQARVEGVAEEMKRRAVREVAATESELAQARGVARVSQVVDYLFYVLYGLVGLVIVLELLGARERNAFKQFLDAVTAPFLAPFRGLMPDPAIGSFQLMASYIIALVVYVLLHLAVNGALRLLVSRKTAV